jgi:hypothetical protein
MKVMACASGLMLAAAPLTAPPAFASVTLLLAAGSGGGSAYGPNEAGGGGVTTTSGANGEFLSGGAGGVGGLGGAGGTQRIDSLGIAFGSNGGGGAGWLGNGGSGLYADSGQGGFDFPSFAGGFALNGYGHGGFGGGGGAGAASDVANGGGGGGGGGGYSGGGGGGLGGGGGGGSYVASSFTNVTLQGADNGSPIGGLAGQNGYVRIAHAHALTLFGYTGSIVDYVAPSTGLYFIQAVGAQGGSVKPEQGSGGSNGLPGGYGAVLSGDVTLDKGTKLEIVVGQGGGYGFWSFCCGGGGGGGSFVWENAATAIPEPSTFALMLIAFAGLGFLGHRKAFPHREWDDALREP